MAIALGLVLGTVPVLYRFINPLVEFVRPVPTPAVVPPLILLLGVGDAMKICIVALSTFFPVFVNTVNGVRSTGDVLLQTAATFRTGAVATVLKVVLPASWPAIVAGLRTSMALALIVTVIAEMIAGSSGIGFYLIESQFALKPDAMYAGVLALMLLGYGLNRTILLAEAFLLRNRRAQ
ncbi:MAG: ABC transporter permease [Lautropia sp.]